MYPHDKLDWHLSRLERRLEEAPDDNGARVQFATAALSKAWFHDGGELWFNQALTHARRVLQSDAGSVDGLVIAGSALVGLDRPDPASRYLDEAERRDAERADLRLARGRFHWQAGDRHLAVRELEQACRLAPDAWEAHAWLGQVLAERAEDLRHPARLHERSRFHVVRALQLGPSPAAEGPLTHLLAVSCLQSERYEDAHKLFLKLQGVDAFRSRAEFYLGLVNYHLGKYKNAVLHLRRRLQDQPDDPRVHARLGMCFLHLGETDKAREACNRALAADPEHAGARWTLSCALLEEGQVDEAVRLLKELLADMPDHLPAFTELVGVRRRAGDRRWLIQALRAEVGHYDKLPLAEVRGRPGSRGTVAVAPRSITRERIDAVIDALGTVGEDPVGAVLETMDLATDEALRFHLWERALALLTARRGERAGRVTRRAAQHFGALPGREVLAVADRVPEETLVRGLALAEEDLRRAAVERHGAGADVTTHRKNVEAERQQARAWQASLLAALGARGDRSARGLLLRWASDADPELALAAQAGLVLLGDASAASQLRAEASRRGAVPEADRFLRAVPRHEPRPAPQVVQDPSARCMTCGRRAPEAAWLLAAGEQAVCERCLHDVARRRAELLVEDPGVACAICARDGLATSAVYVFRGTPVCAHCLDQGLGWSDREAVDSYLGAL